MARYWRAIRAGRRCPPVPPSPIPAGWRGHAEPPERAQDRVQHQRRVLGQEGQAEGNLAQGKAGILRQRREVAARGDAGPPRQHREWQRQQARQRGQRQNAKRPGQGGGGRQEPARQQGCEGGGGDEGATQIVDQLPPADRGHAARPPAQADNPGQKLPVAARPAVLAAGVDIVAGREILDHLDIRGECRAGIDSFEQVVAEQGVLGNAAIQRRFEGVDVIDALAGIGAFVEQILIDVRNRRGIGFDPAGAGIDPLKDRSVAADRQRAVTRGCRMP